MTDYMIFINISRKLTIFEVIAIFNPTKNCPDKRQSKKGGSTMKTELIFTRFFSSMIPDWQTYLRAWDRARTAEEAIGLLYAG